MLINYYKLIQRMADNLVDPATLLRELDLPADTFKKMRQGEDSDEAVVERICRRLGCSVSDIAGDIRNGRWG